MKKFIAPLLALFICTACQAQESHLDGWYHKFDSGGSETVKGSVNLSMLMSFDPSPDSSKSWMKKVTMCRFITIDPEKTVKAAQEWDQLSQAIREDQFEEWMSFRKGKEKFRVMEKDRKDGQEDIVCVATDQHGGGVFFHIRGRFDAADKARIQGSIQDGETFSR